MNARNVCLAAPLLLALVLGACGHDPSFSENYYCPQPLTVADADRLTHFKPGAGKDPRDIAYEATLASARAVCEGSRRQILVNLTLRVVVQPGPSAEPGTTSVPYFVRVLDSSNSVVQSQEFTADFRLSPGKPPSASQEELALRLPYQGSDLAGYRIAVGLKPTPEELNYNRRSRGGS
jgi:hypothetical protein